MTRRFELFVALRYLMAKRKQAVISVITAISVIGVAAGVMALVIAVAINTGFQNTLQHNLLAATSHVVVAETHPEFGIEDWRPKLAKLRKLPHVIQASASLYAPVMFNGINPTGGFIRGILPPSEAPPPEVLRHPKDGVFHDWGPTRGGYPPIIVGAHLARQAGVGVGDILKVISAQGVSSPTGVRPSQIPFRVIAIFESGFYDLDNLWAFASLQSVQQMLQVDDVVNALELNLDDIYKARDVAQAADAALGPNLSATTWMEQNKLLLGALSGERIVTIITIGLILLVSTLNILISLIMMVMEKHRDIAILLSMGTRRDQIRKIFILQGVLIGSVGTAIGLFLGYTISFFADKYHWIKLSEEVYSLSYVPFQPRLIDGIWISAISLLVSFLATIYPATTATKIAPAEALRYE